MIDTGKFMYDATQNMVDLLKANKENWGAKDVFPLQTTFKRLYPSIEVNSTDATFERVESGGGYQCDIMLDVFYWYQQVNEKFAKPELEKRASELAIFIAEHPTLGGYSSDVMIERLFITALPEQKAVEPIWAVVAVIRCIVRKEIYLDYKK